VLEAEIVQGRKISEVEISEIKSLMAANPLWSRYRLSRVLAQRWQWYSAAGQLKDMAAAEASPARPHCAAGTPTRSGSANATVESRAF
jgi:hypothetical protein